MEEDYNVIGSVDDDELVYPQSEELPESGHVSVLAELNGLGRRPGKRRLTEEFDGMPNDEHFSHPIDWHMRMPLTLEEREAKRQKQLIEDEIVGRLTNRIIDARRSKACVVVEGMSSLGEDDEMANKEIIMRTPPIDGSPWMGVSSDGNEERFYIRLHRKPRIARSATARSHETRALIMNARSIDGLFRDAAVIRDKMLRRAASDTADEVVEEAEITARMNSEGGGLWVNKYTPKSFAELLSDDGINRNLLTWIKLWDECVFRRKQLNLENLVSEREREVYTLDTGKIRRPLHKVILLSGPAGLGKTTLAGIVARHAGYATVEMNASDSRNVADFERVLEGAVRSVRTIDGAKTGRPNCLIIDEIDGAPVEAIRFLVKALQLTGKKAIRRPIICICNNLFTPSLRDLRAIALSIQMTSTKLDRLVDRLTKIATMERVRVDRGTLTQLSTLCHCDMRLSLNILQFVATAARSENRIVPLVEIQKAVERERMGASSIFDNWSAILDYSKHLDNKGMLHRESERIRSIERVAAEYGDERFVGGLHANYTRLPLPIGILRRAAMTFLYYDRVMLTIHERQNYSVMKYLIGFYAGLHLTVATHNKVQLKYPQLEQAMSQRSRESNETLATVRARLAARSSPMDLVLDLLPMITTIVQPPIKPMNEHLYTKRELAQIQSVVEVMSGYNLTFASVVVNNEVHYTFLPAIDVLTMYNLSDVSHRLNMPSSTRQMIARKIEQHRVRLAIGASDHSDESYSTLNRKTGESSKNVTHLKQTTSADSAPNKNRSNRPVNLHFKYNQGFSNAVKRNIRMSHIAL